MASTYDIQLEFGGGVNSALSDEKILLTEAAAGENFDLDTKSGELRNRAPFDLVGTTPNTSEVRGFATLLKSDGSVSFLVQAGNTVYDWDGNTTFTSKGTVSATAKLRGRISHNFQLDDKVIITDLNLQQNLMEYDGTTLQAASVTKNNGADAFGDFKAKYCFVANERAFYSNVVETTNTLPHLIVGSRRSNFNDISVSDRPSSSLGADDPFFLIQPDLRRINGMVEAFNQVVTSSFRGSIYRLTGSDATDFAFSELYPFSGADGDESVTYVGNDIFFGRQGVIESLAATDQFGDVETIDVSDMIDDDIENFGGWTIVYNQRNQRVYHFPESQSQCLVYYKRLQGQQSPWVKWTTDHVSNFQPTAVMNMYDPADGLEYVFFGDASGNIYRMEGSGSSGDGGSSTIRLDYLSKSFSLPLDQESYQMEGFIEYRGGDAATVEIILEYFGVNVLEERVFVDLPAMQGGSYYGSAVYYGGPNYYSASFEGRFRRQRFAIAGRSSGFQVRIRSDSAGNVAIRKVSLQLQGIQT